MLSQSRSLPCLNLIKNKTKQDERPADLILETFSMKICCCLFGVFVCFLRLYRKSVAFLFCFALSGICVSRWKDLAFEKFRVPPVFVVVVVYLQSTR